MTAASRFRFYLPAIVLFGAAMIVPCIAQDGHSVAPDTTTERAGSPPRPSKDASAGTGKGVNSSAAESDDANVIDTRVTVLPRRSRDVRDEAGNGPAVKTIARRNLLARPRPVHGAAEPAVRNAIGVAVVRHDGFGQRASERGNLPIILRGPAPATNARAHASVKPIILTHGGISGTGLVRHASAPAAIGGPATSLGGINGTSIRPKHSARP